MKRIDEIKVARQKRFWNKRMEKAKEHKINNIQRELEKHVDLITDETVKGHILEKLEEKREKQIVNLSNNTLYRRRTTG